MMTSLLFEDFWFLLAGCVVVWVVFATGYFFRLTRGWRRGAVFSPVVFAVLLVINGLVVTDAEAIRNTIDRSIQACKNHDAEGLEPLIDEGFDTAGLSKGDLVKAAAGVFGRVQFKSIRMTGVQIDPPGARLAVWSDLAAAGQTGLVKTEWRLEFVKGGDGRWRYTSATPVRINNQPLADLVELINLSHSPF